MLGIRRKLSPKRRWLDNNRNDLSVRGMSGKDAQTQAHAIHRPHIKVGKNTEEEEY